MPRPLPFLMASVLRVLAFLLLVGPACSPRTVPKEAGPPTDLLAPLPAENHFAAPDAASTPFYAAYARDKIPWQAWTKEVLDSAVKTNRPLMLHVGYSTCPFSRRLREQVLSDPELAAYLSSNFTCVLLDAEDHLAMNNLLLECLPHMGTVPAWPMLVWLDYSGRPFQAHSFIRNDGFTSAGIKSTGEKALSVWRFGPEYIARSTEDILLKVVPATPAPDSGKMPATSELLNEAYHFVARSYNSAHGTVSADKNFPRPQTLKLMLALAENFPEDGFRRQEMLEGVNNCLRRMRDGAIFDPLDHTFHRYSEKPNWDAPHSEKLLVDQAMISSVYLDAAKRFGDLSFRETAFAVLDAVVSDWQLSDGFYVHAKTAFVPPDWTEPPPFIAPWFTWSAAETKELLSKEESDVVLSFHGIRERGNMPPSLFSPLFKDRANVLTIAQPLEKVAKDLNISLEVAGKRLSSAHAIMRETRKKRPGAFVDDRSMVAGNGFLLATLSQAALTEGGERYLAPALKLRDHLLKKALGPDGDLATSGWWQDRLLPSPPSHLDHAALLHGLLAAHALKPDPALLHVNELLQSTIVRLFSEPQTGAFQSYGPGTLLPTAYPFVVIADGGTPSDNAVTASNLRILAKLTGKSSYLEARDHIINLIRYYPKQTLTSHALLVEFVQDAGAKSPLP